MGIFSELAPDKARKREKMTNAKQGYYAGLRI
jgi:hypothetical protein